MAEIGECGLETAELILAARLDHGLDGLNASAHMRHDGVRTAHAFHIKHTVGQSDGPAQS